MTRQLVAILAIVLSAGITSAEPQKGAAFSSQVIDNEATQSLEKAEGLYSRGNYKRAYFIYRNELAPIGDKYAQYMVGYMHLLGQGVEQDRVAAAVWYRLAAERGTREFVMVHNQLLVSLTPEQLVAYDRVFLDLRKRYGDLALLIRAIRTDFELLRQRTGSRLGSNASYVTIIDMRNRGSAASADEYYEKIENRLKSRLETIGRYDSIEITDYDLDKLDLANLEQQVKTALESLD